MGGSFLTKTLFFMAVAFVCSDLVITVFTIFYQRYLYDRLMRSRYRRSFTPGCAIVVPCKGTPKDIERNLQSFLELDYPDYKVVFSVESDRDSATNVIRELVTRNSRAQLAVAGLSTTCVQKNHNLLAGLALAGEVEVYVFADADIQPDPTWLRELVLPLADSRITATSGFRWLHAKKGTMGELAHSYVNVFMYVLFSAACFLGGVGLWGGSMAIRRRDFEDLGVADKWSRAGVDDMSLSHLVAKARRKAVVVPHCIIETDDLLPTVKGTIRWFERQIMYLKSYFRSLWFVIAPLSLIACTLLLLLPFSLISSLSPERTFLSAGGGAALVFYGGQLATVALYPLLGSMHSFRKFLLLWPFLRMTQIVSYCLTAVTNTITWAGIRYELSFNGDVSRIERPGNER